MRTTVTFDDDVARLIEEEQYRTRSSMKEVINAAIRAALKSKPARTEPFRQAVHSTELQPGYDLAGFNRLADELEDEAIVDGMRRAGS